MFMVNDIVFCSQIDSVGIRGERSTYDATVGGNVSLRVFLAGLPFRYEEVIWKGPNNRTTENCSGLTYQNNKTRLFIHGVLLEDAGIYTVTINRTGLHRSSRIFISGLSQEADTIIRTFKHTVTLLLNVHREYSYKII